MAARFEIQLHEIERDNLLSGSKRHGMSAAAVVRFGVRWAISRLDVLASGGTAQSERSITKFINDLRAHPRGALAAEQVEKAFAALDSEGDGNRDAAALFDMAALIAAEEMPLPDKLRLLSDLIEFEGNFTIRRRSEPVRADQPQGEKL